MTFTTFTFLIFVVLVFRGYWQLAGRSSQNLLLLIASYVFYGWWDFRFCFLIMLSSVVDYAIALRLTQTQHRAWRRVLVFTSIASNLGLLGFFKYFNFFQESLASALGTLGVPFEPFRLSVVLPVGISFYTFQTLSYTLDVYRRNIAATRDFVAYMAYVSFFPQLVAGPIERACRLLPQFQQKREFDYATAADGLRRILWGLFKKMAVADNLAILVDGVYGNPSGHNGLVLAFVTTCFAFQIYCDFSGYSDIAIGVARLFGIDLMRNFAYPYFAQSVPEFWRRWHVSLSTWFRDYVFIPLGGSKGSKWRTSRNILLTFAISGLWHGASWTFLVWGVLNGIGMLPSVWSSARRSALKLGDVPGGDAWIAPPRALLKMLWTFCFISTTWVFFRASTISDALMILQKIASSLGSVSAWTQFGNFLSASTELGWAMVHLTLFVAVEWLQRHREHGLDLAWPRTLRWSVYTFLIFDVLTYGTHGQSAFLYFQF